MISATNNRTNPAFTSVVPVRVFIDGMETFDSSLIKSSCRQLGNVLTKEAKTDKSKTIMEQFAKYDPDFNPKMQFPSKPSDFIRVVFDRGRAFLTTGPQTEAIQKYGKLVGDEKRVCKERNVLNSYDLMVAKKNYGRVIADILNYAQFRMAESSEQLHKLVTLNVNMKSNGKHGLSTFKTQLDNIDFIS